MKYIFNQTYQLVNKQLKGYNQIQKMMKNYLPLILLLTISLSQTPTLIKLVPSCPNQNTFIQSQTKVNFESTLQKRPNGVRAQVLKICRGWAFSNDQEFRSETSKIDRTDDSQKRCPISYFWFQQKISLVTKVYSDSNSLLPGTVIQTVDPTDFARGLIPVYIPDRKKNPINITIYNGLNANLINITNRGHYQKELSEVLMKNLNILNGNPIEVFTAKPEEAEQLIRQLGLSSKIYEQLQISTADSGQINKQRKIVIVIFQKLFSASVNFTVDQQGNAHSIPETLFNSLYTLQDFYLSSNWGPRKIPYIVSQSNYGRLAVLSINSNFRTEKAREKLVSCFTGGVANIDCFSSVMNQIKLHSGLRYYVAGVDSSKVTQPVKAPFYRETIDWKKVFFPLNEKNIDLLNPLSARMLSFIGKPYWQIQNRYFSSRVCTKNAGINIIIDQISGTLTARVKRSGMTDFGQNIFSTNRPGNFPVQSGFQPFSILFTLDGHQQKGARFFFIKVKRSTYSRQLKMRIEIDGQIKMTKYIGNYRASERGQTFTVQIDPIKGVAN